MNFSCVGSRWESQYRHGVLQLREIESLIENRLVMFHCLAAFEIVLCEEGIGQRWPKRIGDWQHRAGPEVKI